MRPPDESCLARFASMRQTSRRRPRPRIPPDGSPRTRSHRDHKSKVTGRAYIPKNRLPNHATQVAGDRATGRGDTRLAALAGNLLHLGRAGPLAALGLGRSRKVLGLGRGTRRQRTIPFTERGRIRREAQGRLTGVRGAAGQPRAHVHHPRTRHHLTHAQTCITCAHTCITSPTDAFGSIPNTDNADAVPRIASHLHCLDAIGYGDQLGAHPSARSLRPQPKPDARTPVRVARALRDKAGSPQTRTNNWERALTRAAY